MCKNRVKLVGFDLVNIVQHISCIFLFLLNCVLLLFSLGTNKLAKPYQNSCMVVTPCTVFFYLSPYLNALKTLKCIGTIQL